jgi:biotin synthase-related radical SAM superfamily protein
VGVAPLWKLQFRSNKQNTTQNYLYAYELTYASVVMYICVSRGHSSASRVLSRVPSASLRLALLLSNLTGDKAARRRATACGTESMGLSSQYPAGVLGGLVGCEGQLK